MVIGVYKVHWRTVINWLHPTGFTLTLIKLHFFYSHFFILSITDSDFQEPKAKNRLIQSMDFSLWPRGEHFICLYEDKQKLMMEFHKVLCWGQYFFTITLPHTTLLYSHKASATYVVKHWWLWYWNWCFNLLLGSSFNGMLLFQCWKRKFLT